MNPIQHKSNNTLLSAPKGVKDEDCSALPTTRIQFKFEPNQPNPGEACVSYWKPTDNEIALLRQGNAVRVTVWGHTHAPIALGVENDGVYPEPM